jgi:hypothetical protein
MFQTRAFATHLILRYGRMRQRWGGASLIQMWRSAIRILIDPLGRRERGIGSRLLLWRERLAMSPVEHQPITGITTATTSLGLVAKMRICRMRRDEGLGL